MNAYKPLPSNATTTATLYLDTNAPISALLADASRRIDATRDLASALSVMGDARGSVAARDLAAFGLVVEILTSDAAAILEAIEQAESRSRRGSP